MANSCLEELVGGILNELPPMKTAKTRNTYKNWISDSTKQEMKRRDEARMRAKMTDLDVYVLTNKGKIKTNSLGTLTPELRWKMIQSISLPQQRLCWDGNRLDLPLASNWMEEYTESSRN